MSSGGVASRRCRRRHLATTTSSSRSSTQEGAPLALASEVYGPTSTPTTGTSARPIVLLHGLFGSKQNWRSIAKHLASALSCPVHALDVRNHGDSPHHPVHTYPAMSADLTHYLHTRDLQRVTLLGHSMGGKLAMFHALQQQDASPSRIARLVVVDASPFRDPTSAGGSLFADYLTWMRAMDGRCQSRREADAMLAQHIPEESIRQFLLTNLKSIPGQDTLTFRIHLAALQANLSHLWDFPIHLQGGEGGGAGSKDGPNNPLPALFVAGTRANYLTRDMYPGIRRLFPAAEFAELDAGHWVHAERTADFLHLLRSFHGRPE